MKTPQVDKLIQRLIRNDIMINFRYTKMRNLAEKLEKDLIQAKKLLSETLANDVYRDDQKQTIEKINKYLKKK